MTEYVYCLSNPDYTENLYKIGFTNNPFRRAEELYSTGVPSNFIIEFIIKTPDGKLLEKIIHDKLKNYRTNAHREFFRIPITTLKHVLDTELNLNTDMNSNNDVSDSGMKQLINALPAEVKATHFNCDCGSRVLLTNKAKHLKSPLHLDFINQVPKEKKQPNAETTVVCGCGKSFSLKNKSHHDKTKHHIDFINKVPPKPKAETTVDCGCGKSFSLKNKSHHDKTKYHLDWVKTLPF